MGTLNNSATREQYLSLLKKAVHSPIDYTMYNSTSVINNTNCYSHAIGSTLSCIELYRIGAISGLKDINQDYFSINELLNLFLEDMNTLDLKIEDSNLEDSMNSNQYQIALFVKIYADNKIHDFHFYRNDSLGWSEKWRWYKPTMLGGFKELDYFPWHLIGIFKITK